MIFDKATSNSARALGMHVKPKATSGHVMAVKTFRFVGDQHHDAGHGILPFSLVPPGAVSPAARKQTAEDQQRADAFDANQCSENVQGGVNVAEINKMRNLKGHAASEWSEASLQLKAMLPILGTLLGTATASRKPINSSSNDVTPWKPDSELVSNANMVNA